MNLNPSTPTISQGPSISQGPYAKGSAPSPVEITMQAQQNLLMELHKVIINLEERLRVVLTPPPPPPAKSSEASPQLHAIQLSFAIGEHNESISQAVLRLQDIMARLEI